MSIEDKIDRLASAIEALTVLLQAEYRRRAGQPEEVKPPVKPAAKKPAKPKEPEPKIDYTQIAATIARLAKDKGRDAALKALQTFNAKSGKDLKPDQYEAFIAHCGGNGAS